MIDSIPITPEREIHTDKHGAYEANLEIWHAERNNRGIIDEQGIYRWRERDKYTR